jgi:biopolymer transport protein ExbB/TolQ
MTYYGTTPPPEPPREKSAAGVIISGSVAATVVILGIVAVSLVGCPSYSVYTAHKRGEAELAQAQQNRQIRVQEAQAAYEAADFTAKAEIRKAEGVAQANAIMEKSLGGPEGYLRWKYIEMLEENKTHQVIYLPTEAGLPILEAGKAR